MGWREKLKTLFNRQQSPETQPELNIGSPNNNGLREDADKQIPIKFGLIHSEKQQGELAQQLTGNANKAKGEMQIGAPNGNGLSSEADSKIEVKSGLMHTHEEQYALLAEKFGNRRETIYKPMPQNVAVVDEQTAEIPTASRATKQNPVLAEGTLNGAQKPSREAFEQKKAAIMSKVQGPAEKDGRPPVSIRK